MLSKFSSNSGSTSVRHDLLRRSQEHIDVTRCIPCVRLAVQRLRMVQEKKQAQAKSTRRDIATLVERGRIETARIKVENIINEDIHVELLELLELYCELLLARFGLLDLRFSFYNYPLFFRLLFLKCQRTGSGHSRSGMQYHLRRP